MPTGDTATVKTILRDYINATVGFAEVAEATHIPSKSLMRMLGPTGNPGADNLLEIVNFLQNREGVRFHVEAELVKRFYFAEYPPPCVIPHCHSSPRRRQERSETLFSLEIVLP